MAKSPATTSPPRPGAAFGGSQMTASTSAPEAGPSRTSHPQSLSPAPASPHSPSSSTRSQKAARASFSTPLVHPPASPRSLSSSTRSAPHHGRTYDASGNLLFGGLAVDGSGLGETGWASPLYPPMEAYTARTRPREAPRRKSSDKLSAEAAVPHSNNRHLSQPKQTFQPCSPRVGPPTFGPNAADTTGIYRTGSQTSPPSLPQGRAGLSDSGMASTPKRVRPWTPRSAEKAKEGSFVVSLADIVEGRTCRPIALLDLRIYLALQREPGNSTHLTVSSTPSELLPTTIPSLSSATGVSSAHALADAHSEKNPHTTSQFLVSTIQSQATGSLDALNFVIAFDRYTRRFRSLTAKQQRECSRPFEHAQHRCESPAPSEATKTLSESGVAADLATQPLRGEFNRIVEKYLGPVGASTVTGPVRPADTAASPGSTMLARKPRRLDWMVDLGLLSENVVSKALSAACFTTNPAVLLPLVDAVSRYLDAHVIPAFMVAASRNLSRHTSRGRLAVGVIFTLIALVLSVLLVLDPSPLTGVQPHPPDADQLDFKDHRGHIPRWYRILTFPLWAAGIGYLIAAWTGVCVWLTLRGSTEPDGEGRDNKEDDDLETTPTRTKGRRDWRLLAAMATTASATASTANLDEQIGEEGNLAQVDRSNWMMAPEIRRFLRRLACLPNDRRSIVAKEKAPEMSQANATTPTFHPHHAPDFGLPPHPLSPVAEDTPATRSETSPTPPAAEMTAIAPFADLEPSSYEPGHLGKGSTITVPYDPHTHTALPKMRTKALSLLPGLEVGVRTVSLDMPRKSRPPSFWDAEDNSDNELPRNYGAGQAHGRRLSARFSRFHSKHRSVPNFMAGPPSSPQRRPHASSRARARMRRVWASMRRWTGFAVDSERVRDERVRRIHLRAAFQAFVLDMALSVVVVIIIVAIP